MALFNIGNTYLYQDQSQKAKDKFNSSLIVAKTARDHEGHSLALIQLAAIAERQNDIEKRHSLLIQAAAILTQNGLPVEGWLADNGY